MSCSSVSSLFYSYLQQQNLLTTCHIRQLEADFINFKQRNVAISQTFSFFQVIYELEYTEQPMLKVKDNGFVVFTKSKRIEERAKLFNILRNTKNMEKLFNGNGSIEISCHSNDCETENGHFTFTLHANTASFTIVVKNIGNSRIRLKKCLPLRDTNAFTFSDQAGATKLCDEYCQHMIAPGSTYNIQVQCQIKEKVARYDTDLFFNFQVQNAKHETFRMLRLLTCIKSNELVKELQPTREFTRREKIFNYKTSTCVGVAPLKITGDKLEKIRRLPNFEVPKDLIVAVRKKVFTKNPQLTIKEREWRNLLQDHLTALNYSKKFSLLLHLEEIQGQKDIRLYDMKKVTLKKSSGGHRFWLEIPGLAEKRPSVIRGDLIHLHELDSNGVPTETLVHGIVHEVHLEKVLLGINEGYLFTEATLFDVVFTFSRIPIRVQHRSAGGLLVDSHPHLLFPEDCGGYDEAERQFTFFRADIQRNPEQMRAVDAIVRGISIVPYVIYGPPGTGKTVTLVEAISQVVTLYPNSHVLVCSPSNSATDLLAERLLKNIKPEKMFRMCANSRDFKYSPKCIEPLVNYNKANHEYFFPSKEELGKYNVILTTLITAGRLASAKFPSDHFQYVFIDEAGYATEPEFMSGVAGILSKKGRVVMAGDPKQLGPVLYSRLAGLYGLGLSYLERISQLKVYQPNDNQEYDHRFITKLVKNYRSHKAILEVPNECFYDNELEECADPSEKNMLCGWEKLPTKNFPIIFHSIKGKDMRESNSPSYFNPEEVVVVVEYVRDLLSARGNGVTPRDIGIVSPYRKQTSKIRQGLRKAFPKLDLDKLKVGSVEEFQGQEKRVIIISTVRSSNEHLKEDNKFRLGFLGNPKRFNVSITRAKSLLIVVGDPEILCTDHYWVRFINYCVENGAYVGVPVDDRVLHREDYETTDVEDLLKRARMLELEDVEEDPTLDARREE